MKEVRIAAILPIPEAWAFAQFLKRVGFGDYRQLAANEQEAHEMVAAGECVRSALADVGIAPR